MRHEVTDSRPRDTLNHRHSKQRHQKSSSLMQVQSGQSKAALFPAYPRDASYKHPLDEAGQEKEKQAVAQLTSDNV